MQSTAPQKVLLVLDYTTNWYQRFKGAKVGEFAIKVLRAVLGGHQSDRS